MAPRLGLTRGRPGVRCLGPRTNARSTERESVRAHVVTLANGEPVVPQGGMRSGDVKEELRWASFT